jgi:hypothetical protein
VTSGQVPGFLPGISGLHFKNSFPSGSNYPVITLPVVGTIVSQDAATGLCGGFVLTVLDAFLRKPRLRPPLATDSPADGTVLFNYLVRRLLDSFGTPPTYDNAAKAIQWIQTPDHDASVSLYGPGLARRMVETEWPMIKSDIDSGKPSPLYLIMAPQCGLGDIPGIQVALGRSHQVLVYRYELDDAIGNLTLGVYDPNDPNDNNSSIMLNISDPGHTIIISAPGIEANLPMPVTIRGLFRTDYALADPSALGLVPTGATLSPVLALLL